MALMNAAAAAPAASGPAAAAGVDAFGANHNVPGRRRLDRTHRVRNVPNDQRLGFWIERALHAYRLLLDDAFDELGIAPGQESLLVDIHFADCAWSMDHFARRLGVRKQTVSRSLRRLRIAGMVDMRPSADGRQKRITLTPHGELVLRVVGDALRLTESALLEELGADTADAAAAVLRRIVEALRRVRAERLAPPPPLCSPEPVVYWLPADSSSG